MIPCIYVNSLSPLFLKMNTLNTYYQMQFIYIYIIRSTGDDHRSLLQMWSFLYMKLKVSLNIMDIHLKLSKEITILMHIICVCFICTINRYWQRHNFFSCTNKTFIYKLDWTENYRRSSLKILFKRYKNK